MPKQLPNIITCIRIALIPVFATFYLAKKFEIAIAILALVMLSDLVDGYIARKYNLLVTGGSDFHMPNDYSHGNVGDAVIKDLDVRKFLKVLDNEY